ncbi:hypothetical protein P3S68_002608 [Capsicum galapagoense]
MDIIVTIQFTYGGVFLSDPDLRYTNGIRIPDKIRVDVDELHVMLFHNLAADLDVEKIETFWCRVNKKSYYYKLENDVDVLSLISSLKNGDLVDVYVVHQISESILVNDDVATPFKPDRADVSSSHSLDINEDEYINENQSPRAEKGKAKVSCEDLDKGQFNDFSTYHLQIFDSELDFDWTDFDGDSLYDVDENIEELSDFDEELLQVRKANIEKQAKETVDRVNLDEIPSGPVGIYAGFEDIYKNNGVRYEGKLDRDDPYFNSSDPGSDISDKEERDPVDDDEVVDSLPRTSSSKIYFDKTAKKGLHLTLTNILPNAEHRWCARHIWANWKQKLNELSELGVGIVEDLLKYNKEAWCRAFFKEHSRCDVVENNMCETFNSWILAARFKTIITMLEEIRCKVMEKINQMRDFPEKWITNVSPMAMEVLTKNGEYAANCEVRFNGDMGFEIGDPPYTYVVNVKRKQCSCRSWQLKEISCVHAIAAIHYKG